MVISNGLTELILAQQILKHSYLFQSYDGSYLVNYKITITLLIPKNLVKLNICRSLPIINYLGSIKICCGYSLI